MTNPTYTLIFGWLLVVFLTGCIQPSHDGVSQSMTPSPGTSGSLSTSETSPPKVDGLSVERPTELFWTNCTGGQGTVIYSASPQPPVPAGWEEDFPPGEQILWHYLKCQRVSLGPFERGPVDIMLETSGAGSPPESCLDDGEFIAGDLMHNFWISDPEIAAYLVEFLGMPAWFATFTTSSVIQHGVELFSVEWGHPDDEPSKMTFARHGAVLSSSVAPYRNFWFNQTLLGHMDMVFDSQRYDAGGPLAGQMAPPSVYAVNGFPMPLVGAKGSLDVDMEVQAKLYYFEDPECKTPA